MSDRGRFIVFPQFRTSIPSRTIIFPEGSNADDGLHFLVIKILKESLIYGHNKVSPKLMSGPIAFKSKVGRHLSYATAVRGRANDSQSPLLKEWRHRECG